MLHTTAGVCEGFGQNQHQQGPFIIPNASSVTDFSFHECAPKRHDATTLLHASNAAGDTQTQLSQDLIPETSQAVKPDASQVPGLVAHSRNDQTPQLSQMETHVLVSRRCVHK